MRQDCAPSEPKRRNRFEPFFAKLRPGLAPLVEKHMRSAFRLARHMHFQEVVVVVKDRASTGLVGPMPSLIVLRYSSPMDRAGIMPIL